MRHEQPPQVLYTAAHKKIIRSAACRLRAPEIRVAFKENLRREVGSRKHRTREITER